MSESYTLDRKRLVPRDGANYRCAYEDCKTPHEFMRTLDISKGSDAILDDTELTPNGVTLPFCKYHFHIVMGGEFTVLPTTKPNESEEEEIVKVVMTGPFKQVQITEQVIAAREVIVMNSQ